MTAPSSSTDTSERQTPQHNHHHHHHREYHHIEILHSLQTTSSRQSLQNSPSAIVAHTSRHDPAKRAIDNNGDDGDGIHVQSWNLSDDARLATLLREFSSHVLRRTEDVSLTIRALQERVDQAGLEVWNVAREFGNVGEDYFLEQVVGDDDDDDDEEEEGEGEVREKQEEERDDDEESEGDGKSDQHAKSHSEKEKPHRHEEEEEEEEEDQDDREEQSEQDSTASIARLEAEEKSAILNGMLALSLFYDPQQQKQQQQQQQHPSRNAAGVNNTATGEDDIIGDHSYYYHCAEGDVFNERALPFIIGSREFMESSSCVGLGRSANSAS